MKSAAAGIFGAADEVVEGDVEEVGEGDEDVKSRFSSPGFVILYGELTELRFGSELLLRQAV